MLARLIPEPHFVPTGAGDIFTCFLRILRDSGLLLRGFCELLILLRGCGLRSICGLLGLGLRLLRCLRGGLRLLLCFAGLLGCLLVLALFLAARLRGFLRSVLRSLCGGRGLLGSLRGFPRFLRGIFCGGGGLIWLTCGGGIFCHRGSGLGGLRSFRRFVPGGVGLFRRFWITCVVRLSLSILRCFLRSLCSLCGLLCGLRGFICCRLRGLCLRDGLLILRSLLSERGRFLCGLGSLLCLCRRFGRLLGGFLILGLLVGVVLRGLICRSLRLLGLRGSLGGFLRRFCGFVCDTLCRFCGFLWICSVRHFLGGFHRFCRFLRGVFCRFCGLICEFFSGVIVRGVGLLLGILCRLVRGLCSLLGLLRGLRRSFSGWRGSFGLRGDLLCHGGFLLRRLVEFLFRIRERVFRNVAQLFLHQRILR